MNSQIKLKKQRLIFPENYNFSSRDASGWYVGAGWEYDEYISQGNFIFDGLFHSPGSTEPAIACVKFNVLSGMFIQVKIVNNAWIFGELGSISVKFNGVSMTDVSSGGLIKSFNLYIDESFVLNTDNEYEIEITPSSDSNFIIDACWMLQLNNITEYELEMIDDNFNTTFQVNDIRDISNRNSSFNKKFSIPITKYNQMAFNNILDINSDTLLNDNYLYRNIDAELLYKSELIDKGFCRIVFINRDNETFEIEFFGEVANLATACGDDYIFDNDDISKDIDVSDLQHTFSWETINSSWYSLKESGFTYPIIDYTIPDPSASNLYYLKDARPAMYLPYLFNKIIDSVGFSATGSFLNSMPYTEAVILWSGADLTSPQSYLQQERRVYADFISNSTSTISLTQQGGYLYGVKAIYFPNEIEDPSNQHSSTGTTILNAGTYQITSQVSISVGSAGPIGNQFDEYISTCITINGDIRASSSSLFKPAGNLSISGVCYAANTFELNVGDVVKIGLVDRLNTGFYSTATRGYTILSGSFFRLDPLTLQTQAYPGDIIDMSKIFGGEKVKKIDFIMSIVKRYNLIIDYDKLSNRTLKIETNDVYYSGGTLRDWTDYIDINSEKITRIGDIVNKSYIFSPAADTDTYNTEYTDYYSVVYGENRVNDEINSKDTITIKDIFAPTLLGYHSNTKVIVSKIYEKDKEDPNNSKIIKRDFKPRIAYYKNIEIRTPERTMVLRPPEYPLIGDITLGFWFIPGTSTYCFQPYAGHLDDPYDDNYDLNYGTMSSYFVSFSGGSITPHNLVNDYWFNHLRNIMDHDSKLVTYDIKIPFNEIKDFSMADTIKIKNTHYIINKIIDWSPDNFCKIELLKLAENYLRFRKKLRDPSQARVPVGLIEGKKSTRVIDKTRPEFSAPIYIDASGEPLYYSDMENYPPVYYNNKTNIYDPNSNIIVVGSGNVLNNALNTYVVGDDNYIGIGQEGVMIFGKNNIVE